MNEVTHYATQYCSFKETLLNPEIFNVTIAHIYGAAPLQMFVSDHWSDSKNLYSMLSLSCSIRLLIRDPRVEQYAVFLCIRFIKMQGLCVERVPRRWFPSDALLQLPPVACISQLIWGKKQDKAGNFLKYATTYK